MTGRTLGAARVATLAALPVALLAGVLAFWWLGGFTRAPETGPVPLPAATLDAQTATVCRAVLARLPDKDGRLRRRPVTAGAEQNAAYGDPPVTVACGAVAVPSLPPTATIYHLSGVCWYASEAGDATVWTSLYHEVPVQARVPRAYEQPGQLVIQFSGPVRDADPP